MSFLTVEGVDGLPCVEFLRAHHVTVGSVGTLCARNPEKIGVKTIHAFLFLSDVQRLEFWFIYRWPSDDHFVVVRSSKILVVHLSGLGDLSQPSNSKKTTAR